MTAGQAGGEREVCDPVSSCEGHRVVNEVADVTFWCMTDRSRVSIVEPEEPSPAAVPGQAAREAAVEAVARWLRADRLRPWDVLHPSLQELRRKEARELLSLPEVAALSAAPGQVPYEDEHVPYRYRSTNDAFCRICRYEWPCPTARAE